MQLPVFSVAIVQDKMFFKDGTKIFDLLQILTTGPHFSSFTLNKRNKVNTILRYLPINNSNLPLWLPAAVPEFRILPSWKSCCTKNILIERFVFFVMNQNHACKSYARCDQQFG